MTMPRELRYLESEAVIRERLFKISGRHSNARNAAFVSSCLLHGRLFWESAESAPLETRPLMLYYGAASFAKALIFAYSLDDLSKVASQHGLSCRPGEGDLIANYSVTAKGQGLFQQFNDVVSSLNQFEFFEHSNLRIIPNPTAKSDRLQNLNLTIEQALSRIPSLAEDYTLCTGKTSKTLGFTIYGAGRYPGLYDIRVDDKQVYSNIDELKAIVKRTRERAPFLSKWRIVEASDDWNSSIMIFNNLIVTPDEFDKLEEHRSESGIRFDLPEQIRQDTSIRFDHLHDLIPLAQPRGGFPAYVSPVEGGAYLSSYSLMLLTLLGLSSLVRYEPHTWTACIHRRKLADRPADDTLLPVIEQFLAHAMVDLPKFVVAALIPD